MATPNEYIARAASYIGVSGTDNIFNTWYWGHHCYDPDTYPWCACFMSYVGIVDCGMDFKASASASGVAWQGIRVADEDAQPGDWVLFNWDGSQDFSWADHIALMEWTDINGSGHFGTIDGNSGGGEGCVQRNTYDNNSYYGTAFFRPSYDNSKPTPAPQPTPVPDKTRLNMIDIASWQVGLTPSSTPADAVAIKVTGGTHYENPYWRQWANDVLASGKSLAFYHYAVEEEDNPNAKEEAEFFLSKVMDFKGKFIPILDWEADAIELDQSWAREWMDIVAKKTEAVPVFYGYASNINTSDYDQISAKYPLWMASYLSKYAGYGFQDDPEQLWEYGDWDDIWAYQYTSEGYISGYDGDLDLSIVYCSTDEWWKMAGGEYKPEPKPEPTGKQPYYNVNCGFWCGRMKGLVDTTGSGDDFGGVFGRAMRYIAIGDVGEYQVCDINGTWWPTVDHYDTNDEDYGMAGAGTQICCVRIFDSSVHYQTHNLGGGWNDVMVGTHDTGGSGDDFAGQYGVPQDAIRIWRE